MHHEEHDDYEEDGRVSKSQLKRDMQALQELGEQLIGLGRDQLLKLDLPERLFNAILEAKRITHFGALKRQRQYIGRLMRDVDPAPIQALLSTLKGENDEHTAWLHHLERQRDLLLAEEHRVAALIEEHPDLDIQHLRQLVRNARSERASQSTPNPKPPKAYRALFQLLKTLYPEPPLGGTAAEDDEEEDDER
ncbi:ribosome biogenesis factor YjgA [Chitinimonas lacunae]|uniref:Dual-action ribosomal maturation protein DarP n=1 Tax=Chitinimonas lacunae TaxID=1963018 RepID=A0ABV8MMN4_9NEIS